MDDRFEHLIDLYGADFNNWPDTELAQQARAAALRDSQFRMKLDAARRVDRSLASLSAAFEGSATARARSADMQDAILKRIDEQAQRRRAFSFRSLSRMAAGIVLACGLGIGVGQIVPDQPLVQNDAFDELLLGLGDPGAGTRNG